jgi:translation initiation factor IF-2
MGKMRVYELAKKLGMDNKDLLDKLQASGIETDDPMFTLDEDAVQRLERGETPQDVKIEEERINPGIIRRRKKAVASEDEPEAPVAEPVVAVDPAPVPAQAPVVAAAPPVSAPVVPPVEADAKPTPKAKDVVEPEVVAPPVAETTPEPVIEKPVTPEPPLVDEAPAAAAPVVDAPPARTEKSSPNRARILGRVELPIVAERPSRGGAGDSRNRPGQGRDQRPSSPGRDPRPSTTDSQRPARPVGEQRPSRPGNDRPGGFTPAPMEAPQPDKEQRGGKKRKKGKDRVDVEVGDQSRRRSRREVFEPDRQGGRRGKRAVKPLRKTEITVSKAIKRIIRISDVITVGELAKRMGVKANDLIRELMSQGQMVTINHPLDFDTAAILASEFQYEVENIAFDEDTMLDVIDSSKSVEDAAAALEVRPPVVTIMGHVDHGKTSLLDAIRTAKVTEGEAGGITQHIGAYDVEIDGRKIAFLDTPGHEAFTAMRSRGAQVTDIVILVVAADDGVMPQTREAINHAKAAGVPIIVAINKMDKPDANPDRVKQELTEYQLVPEDWGGDTIFVEVSAKQKTNIDQLLELILLQAEVLDLRANPNKRAKGAVIEARLDKGRGPVATVLVQEGTLKVGDPIVTGGHFGRVRSMVNDKGNAVAEAGPSCPVEVTGMSGVPAAGDSFHSVEDEKVAKDVAQHRQQKMREAEMAKHSKISLEQLFARIQDGEAKELKVIIKADVQGSVEAVKDSLSKLSTDSCRLVVLHTGVGGIIESDITLASASDAIVLGFNVRPESKASSLADIEGVDIRLYTIIYDAVEDIKNAMEGLLAPTYREKHLGRVEVRDTFHVSKVGTIAGCFVLDGKIVRNAKARLVRDNVVVWEGTMNSLKRFKDDAREVQAGYECGVGLERYNDVKVGDIIEVYEMEEIKSTL